MARFFNATNGPLSFSLTDGAVAGVAARKYVAVPDETATSAAVVRLLQQKKLVRVADISAAAPMTRDSKANKPAPTASPVTVPNPLVVKDAPIEAKAEPKFDKSPKIDKGIKGDSRGNKSGAMMIALPAIEPAPVTPVQAAVETTEATVAAEKAHTEA